jgi:outer membrane immunogenic protein
MKKLLIAATTISSLVTFANTASAADPVDITYDWSGAYVGVQGGFLAANTNIENRNLGVINAQSTPDFDGFFGGAHLGYNLVLTNVVLGLETEVNFADGSSGFETARNAGGVPIPPNQHRAGLDWTGSTRVRAGFTADQFLPFLTAGIAYGGVDAFLDHTGGDNPIKKTMVGWTAGAGLDYAITDAWVLGFEYRYTDYGSVTKQFPGFPNERSRLKLQSNDFRLSASFKF